MFDQRDTCPRNPATGSAGTNASSERSCRLTPGRPLSAAASAAEVSTPCRSRNDDRNNLRIRDGDDAGKDLASHFGDLRAHSMFEVRECLCGTADRHSGQVFA